MVVTAAEGFSTRLNRALDRSGFIQGRGRRQQLASVLGVSGEAARKWLSGESMPSMQHATHLARIACAEVDWLLTGRSSAPPTLPDLPNVSPGPPLRGRVPLVSWVQAGDEREAIDLLPPGQADEWVETTVQVRAHTYALRVEGDSMLPLFPPGTLLVVEPELDAQPGDYVIAKNGAGEVSFKQLVRDGGDWYLKPLNERYPIKPLGAAKIIGVVREAVQRFR